MVLGLLEKRKKLTRRTKGLEKVNVNPNDWELTPIGKNICRMFYSDTPNPNPIKKFLIFENKNTKEQVEVSCPYGVVRDDKSQTDVLWVRECFGITGHPTYKHVYKLDALLYQNIPLPKAHPFEIYHLSPLHKGNLLLLALLYFYFQKLRTFLLDSGLAYRYKTFYICFSQLVSIPNHSDLHLLFPIPWFFVSVFFSFLRDPVPYLYCIIWV